MVVSTRNSCAHRELVLPAVAAKPLQRVMDPSRESPSIVEGVVAAVFVVSAAVAMAVTIAVHVNVPLAAVALLSRLVCVPAWVVAVLTAIAAVLVVFVAVVVK